MSMHPFTLSEIAASCGGRLVSPPECADMPITGVVRDSRQVRPGNLFLCIKGAVHDGHDFAENAYRLGALCCLCERPLDTDKPYIIVSSVPDALRYIAKRYREKLDIPIVGIVGSVGKTTAKEMTAAVLARKYCVLKTPENLNNELGVPLTVLSIGKEHTAAVIEMGISDFGEMSRLAEIVRPNICVITVIGYCHLENLGDLNGVMRAKGEVFDYMPRDGYAVLNGDDDILKAYDPKINKITFGLSSGCDFIGSDIENLAFDGVSCRITHDGGDFSAHINGFGAITVPAALAACAVGKILSMDDSDIALGISDYRTISGRANVSDTGHITVIDDCYNANPNSVRASLDSLSAVSGRTVAVLGDMLELGETTENLHFGVGKYGAEKGIDVLICCGELGKYIYDGFVSASEGKKSYYFPDKSEFIEKLGDIVKKGDTVLVKASHGMHFEVIVSELKKLGAL